MNELETSLMFRSNDFLSGCEARKKNLMTKKKIMKQIKIMLITNQRMEPMGANQMVNQIMTKQRPMVMLTETQNHTNRDHL